jgi:hypothetical protein
MKFLAKRLRWMLIGAAAAWMFDPEHGSRRRQMMVEQARTLIDRTGLVDSPRETALEPDVVTDVAWQSATGTSGPMDDSHLAAFGVSH